MSQGHTVMQIKSAVEVMVQRSRNSEVFMDEAQRGKGGILG